MLILNAAVDYVAQLQQTSRMHDEENKRLEKQIAEMRKDLHDINMANGTGGDPRGADAVGNGGNTFAPAVSICNHCYCNVESLHVSSQATFFVLD